MKLVTIGDSITKGTYCENNEWFIADPCFSDVLKKMLCADEFINLGQNGITYSTTSDVFPLDALSRKVKLIDNDADIIVVAGGTNDYAAKIKIGSAEDTEDISFYGATYATFDYLKTNFKDAKIFVVTPIPRKSDGEKNEIGCTPDDYRHVIKEQAERFGFVCIDGKKLGIDPRIPEQMVKYVPDGLHPNQKCHELYGEFLYNEIKKYI